MSLYEQFLDETELQNLDLRCAYLFVAKELLKFKSDVLDANTKVYFYFYYYLKIFLYNYVFNEI